MAAIVGQSGAPDRSKEQGYGDYVLLLFLYNSGSLDQLRTVTVLN